MFDNRLVSIVTTLAAIALLLWLAISFEQLRLSRDMQSQLQAKAGELDRQLSQLAVVPRILSRHPAITNALIEAHPTALADANVALRNAQIDSGSSFAFLMDTEGTTVAASNFEDAVSFVGINYAFRPYFSGAIANDEATFFAVGATTGEPGYFIADSVKHKDKTVGVVVVKSELAGLLDSWRQPPYHWLAVDELGVVILSTSAEFLYTRTKDLDRETVEIIKSDRRYLPATNAEFKPVSTSNISYRTQSDEQTFLVERRTLTTEEWKLELIIDQWQVWLNAILYVLAISAVGLLAALGYRNVRTQKRLAATEQRHALELEDEVEQRTAELRSAQEALISESNYAMLGRMSGAINHEINQPLASLRLNLASLRGLFDKPEPDMNELRQIVVDSDRTTKRIGRVVTTLRNLSGQQHSEHVQLDVERLLDDIIDTVNRERPAASQSLQLNGKGSGLSVHGNYVLLQQALLNLLYNAFDAVLDKREPMVAIDLEASSDYIAFKVIDNGSGVKPELQESLFKPFVSDKQRTTGLGLGLTLAELIAKEHAGQLDYLARTPAGSIFTLKIPITQPIKVS